MKNIAILGSTGSIGKNTLIVAKHLGYRICALAAHSHIDLLEQQAQQFHPQCIAVFNKEKALELKKRIPNMHVVGGMEGIVEAATLHNTEFVVSAIVGAAGILPTFKAIEAGKTIGLANKEVLIAAGELIMESAHKRGVQILPIDSEHSAIFQCLQGERPSTIKRVILTASGGPFHNRKNFDTITPNCALKHPTWVMGKKITIDCSTLMNKGLEVIEAKMLFNLSLQQIKVIIHPQSIIHSFVEFVDGSILAQMGAQDMQTPIQYALTYPKRQKGCSHHFDIMKNFELQFCLPNWKNFPCLQLAFEAAKIGGTLPCFMNAANEVLVNRFVKGAIGWKDIGKKLALLMAKHQSTPQDNLQTLLAVDQTAREMAMSK